jgi:hypothetical protein
MPRRSHSSTNSGRSLTNPQPAQTASARADRRAPERVEVEVAGAGRAERDRLVGLADEHRAAVGLGEERDRADRLRAVLVELADGVDDAHRGLAPVDDGQPGDRAGGHAIARRMGSSRSASTPPGSAVVR